MDIVQKSNNKNSSACLPFPPLWKKYCSVVPYSDSPGWVDSDSSHRPVYDSAHRPDSDPPGWPDSDSTHRLDSYLTLTQLTGLTLEEIL